MLAFFLARNIASFTEYKRLSKEAVMVFEDQRKIFKVSRVIFLVLFIVAGVLFFLTLFVFKPLDLNNLLALLCLMAGCALFSFVPYTNGRFVVTEKGIYVYNANRFLLWEEIISQSADAKGKDSYLILTGSRPENDRFSRITFPLLVTPVEKTMPLRDLIQDMLALEAKKQRLARLRNGE